MLKAIFILVFIVWSRFFGLFIVLPVLSVYVQASNWQIGLAVGAYALAQIIFAIPFGKLSDLIGRKKTLALGIAVFGVGSLICAISHDVNYLILGRFIQGGGAIGAVASAFVADICPDNKRSKYMALLGAGVGVSFIVAMILGPLLASKFGLNSLFYICLCLCILNLCLLFFVNENSKKEIHKDNLNMLALLSNKNLNILCISNFFTKMFLNILFVSLGLILVKYFDFLRADLWKIYASASIFGFLAMGISGAFGDKGKAKELFLISVACFICSLSLIIFAKEISNIVVIMIAVCIFFIAFSLQEPILQSQTSKITKSSRGAALGLLNACGYLGSFVGSIIGVYINFILYVLLLICFAWFFLLTRFDRI